MSLLFFVGYNKLKAYVKFIFVENDIIVDNLESITDGERLDEMFNPLELAIINKRQNAVKMLVKYGANVNTKPGSYTPLMRACNEGNIEIVKILLETGADRNARDINNLTALLIACAGRNLEMVKLLLDCPDGLIDLNVVSWNGQNALSISCIFGDYDIFLELLAAGALKHDAGKSLSFACGHGSLKIVKTLIELGVNVDHKDEYGRMPLFRAIEGGYPEAVSELLKAGADKNFVDRSGRNAKNLAEFYMRKDIVKLLS